MGANIHESESEVIHFFESRFLDESELIHSGDPGWMGAFVGNVNQTLIHSDESNAFSESTVDSLWGIYEFVCVSGLIAPALGGDMFR